MRHRLIAALTAFASVMLFAAWVQAQTAAAWKGYDEKADAAVEVDKALATAKAANKNVLVVYGANWCGDCRVLDTSMKEGKLKPLIDRDFVVVKVDVGRFDKNVAIAERYGVPLKKGIPTIAVLNAQGKATFATTGGELADARNMGDDGLVAFFDRKW